VAAHSDGDDVENGPRREDGYALLSGDAVSFFLVVRGFPGG
jgi:hypothetical protein